MNINIPPAILNLAPELNEFFEAMVHKLNVNSHKATISEDDIDGLLEKLAEEIQEFRDQRIQDARDPNMLEELADSGNFCFLLYAYLRHRGVMTIKERFIDTFFRIDTERGVVYCKKTRSGSPLKVGDAVGSMRGGECYIRTQHAATGATVSVPRAALVWWAHHGRWPQFKLRHRDGDLFNDAISNLDLIEPEVKGGKFPFVSQYKPKGREETANYGRYVYQRRHAFELVRVGYWDTEEEAAREGVIAWKARIKEKANV